MTHREGTATMRGHVAALGDQLRHSFAATRAESNVSFVEPARIIVSGMGGSAAGAELMRGCALAPHIEIVVNRSYALPSPIRDGDLLVFSSYSGNTEETLSVFEEMRSRGLRHPALVISSGGRLSQLAREAKIPVWEVPGGLPPRAALGHGVGRLCGLLDAIGVAGIAEQVEAAAALLDEKKESLGLTGGPATDLRLAEWTEALEGRMPLLYSGSSMTTTVAHRWRAQLNENSKVLAHTAELPELDHNEIVGWEAPSEVRARAVVVALRDESEHGRVRRRFSLTREVLGERVGRWMEIEAASAPVLARAFFLVQFGDALSVALAERLAIDPMPVEPIDELKSRLSDPS